MPQFFTGNTNNPREITERTKLQKYHQNKIERFMYIFSHLFIFMFLKYSLAVCLYLETKAKRNIKSDMRN